MKERNPGYMEKIIVFLRPYYFLILGLVVASVFFGLGRLSSALDQKEPIKVEYVNTATAIVATEGQENQNVGTTTNSIPKIEKATVIVPPKTESNVIGAKTSKKYYFPWCGTVKRIKAENQVFFKSIEEAKSAGYTPGGNCKGLY
jgi:hypothetical protein